MIKYYASITPTASLDEANIPYRLPIRGVAVTVGANKNGWELDQEVLPKVAKQLTNKTLRINHSSSVVDVVGKITKAEYDGEIVTFEGEIIGSDELTKSLKEKIINGLIDSVSIGLNAKKIVCSVCGKVTREEVGGEIRVYHSPASHGGVERVVEMDIKELSIVADPAYESTKFSISASFEEAMNELFAVSPPEKAAETDVSQPHRDDGRDEEIKTSQEVELMSVVPTAPAESGSADTYEEIRRIIESLRISSDEVAKKLAEFEGRLKKLEESMTKRGETAEEAEEAEEAEDAEAEDAELESKLKKSKSELTASETAIPLWAKEILNKMQLRG